jgi:hypothetical protein
LKRKVSSCSGVLSEMDCCTFSEIDMYIYVCVCTHVLLYVSLAVPYPYAYVYKYISFADAFLRFLDDITKPTPKGEEPTAIKYVKTVTWGAVLVLVLIEIFVSLKVGGAPFKVDLSGIKLPEIPSWGPQAFTPKVVETP